MSVLDGVASLIDKSLLQQTEQEGEEPRLVMLETIREYGLEVLADVRGDGSHPAGSCSSTTWDWQRRQSRSWRPAASCVVGAVRAGA